MFSWEHNAGTARRFPFVRFPVVRRTDEGHIRAMTHDLNHFVRAQDGVYAQALAELRRGAKTSHWMWFVFPQIAGLARSDTARFYALASTDEARAFLAHPVLGPRLVEAAKAAVAAKGDAAAIFGGIDAVKLRSSMTLFETVAPLAGHDPTPFRAALDRFFGGERDAETLRRL